MPRRKQVPFQWGVAEQRLQFLILKQLRPKRKLSLQSRFKKWQKRGKVLKY